MHATGSTAKSSITYEYVDLHIFMFGGRKSRLGIIAVTFPEVSLTLCTCRCHVQFNSVFNLLSSLIPKKTSNSVEITLMTFSTNTDVVLVLLQLTRS